MSVPKYTVHIVSFRNMEHGSAYNVLHRGQTPDEDHLTALESFMDELEGEEQCQGLL